MLRCSTSKVSRLESGKATTPRERDVRDLVEFYEGSAELSAELQALAVHGQDGGWWDDYKDLFTNRLVALHLQRLVALEEYASGISAFSTDLVPGLLQTEDYIRALIELGAPDRPVVQQRRFAEFRLRRQEILRRAAPPRLRVVLDERVLHYAVGGADVLRGQLELLERLVEEERVLLTVLPMFTVTPARFGGAFTVIDFDDPADQDVVYIEGRHLPLYLESPEDVESYTSQFTELENAGVQGDECSRLLKEALHRLDT